MSEVTREELLADIAKFEHKIKHVGLESDHRNHGYLVWDWKREIAIRTLALERLDMDLEAAAKTIMEKTFNCYWESLNAESIKDRGYKPVIYNSHGGNQWQGGKADMIEIAKDALNAALKSTPTHFQEVRP